MVETAVKEFGRIDAVVNNAGFLRDGFFHKMSYEDFGAVVKVHLYGAFNTSRAAADGDVPGGSLIAWVKPAPPLILRQAHGSLRGRPRCYDGLPHVGVRGLDGSKWCSRSRDSAPQSRERSCPRHTS